MSRSESDKLRTHRAPVLWPWRVLLVVMIVLVLGVSAWGLIRFNATSQQGYLHAATLVLLGLTLVAVSIYAFDTHVIALVTKWRWMREGVLSTSYLIEQQGDRTAFVLRNGSTLLVRAKVRCGFRVYGQPVEYHGDFNGKKTWYLYPTQDSMGYFEISKLLEREGKTYDDMRSERKPDNFTTQLTMDLRLEFRDELGNSRALPGRRHFFDFSEKRWVPELTRVDEWK